MPTYYVQFSVKRYFMRLSIIQPYFTDSMYTGSQLDSVIADNNFFAY